MPAEAVQLGTVGRLLALKKLPMLGTLPAQELAFIAERARERVVPRGSVLCREGEPIDALRFVVDGRVHMSRRGLPLGHARAGAPVGGLGVLARDSDGIEAVAELDSLVLEVDSDDVFEILEDRFAILHHILREVSREIIRVVTRLPPGMTPPFPRIEGLLPPGGLDLVERILFLRQAPVFAKSSINALAELSRGLAEVSFDPGVTLWREGESAGAIFLLLSGSVKGTTGAGMTFDAGAGMPLGALESFAERPRWFQAVAASKLVALHGHVEGFIDVFEDNADMALEYLAFASRSLLGILEKLAEGSLERFYGCDDPRAEPCSKSEGGPA